MTQSRSTWVDDAMVEMTQLDAALFTLPAILQFTQNTQDQINLIHYFKVGQNF